jgi:hypothetical protein
MAFFPQNRDVVFSVIIPTVSFEFTGQNFLIKIRGQCIVSTQSKIDKSRTLYMNPINGTVFPIQLLLQYSCLQFSAQKKVAFVWRRSKSWVFLRISETLIMG